MALTPEDVVKKEFSKPKGFGRNGYDEIQVDDFLDEIVVELRRLNAENDELTDKLDDCRKGKSNAAGAAAPAGGASTVPALTPVNNGGDAAAKAEIERLKKELEQAKAQAKQPAAPATSNNSAELAKVKEDLAKVTSERDAAREELERTQRGLTSTRDELNRAKERVAELEKAGSEAKPAALADNSTASSGAAADAAGIVALAQRLHDQHVKEGEVERDRLKSEAKSFHDRTISEAKAKSEELVSTGQKKHDDLVAKGQAEHDRLVKTGTDKSTSLVNDAEERRKSILADLELRKGNLNSEIEKLQNHEADYRNNLRGYLTEQLRKLDDKGQAKN